MATWQYAVELIPRRKVLELFTEIPPSMNEDVYEATEWWSSQQPSDDYETLLRSFAAPCSAWSEDVKCWGEEDGNRIDVLLKGKCVVEVSVRFDLRNLDDVFSRNVIDFAQRNGCVLLGESMEVIEPSVNALKSKLLSSDAARFVRDPALYLEGVARSRQVRRTA